MFYNAIKGSGYMLKDAPLAQGGEGTIYEIQGQPGLVAKVYHADVLASATQTSRREKLLNMMRMPQADSCQYISWPRDGLVDASGLLCGFVMNRYSGTTSLADALPDTQMNWRQRILLAHNLCDVVREVHEMNQCIGDMNPANFGFHPSSGYVYAFDADSFHFRSPSGRYFPCYVGVAEYYAPELQRQICRGQDMRTLDPAQTFSRQTDLFALAVLIFQLLFLGYHPFSARRLESYGSSTVVHRQAANILNGMCAYFNPVQGVGLPVGAPPLRLVSPAMQEMFRQTFLTQTRSSAEEWQRALLNLLQSLQSCSAHHNYRKELSDCPFCTLELEKQARIHTQAEKARQAQQSEQARKVRQAAAQAEQARKARQATMHTQNCQASQPKPQSVRQHPKQKPVPCPTVTQSAPQPDRSHVKARSLLGYEVIYLLSWSLLFYSPTNEMGNLFLMSLGYGVGLVVHLIYRSKHLPQAKAWWGSWVLALAECVIGLCAVITAADDAVANGAIYSEELLLLLVFGLLLIVCGILSVIDCKERN